MTVKDLKQKLSKFPETYDVIFGVNGDFFEVVRVASFETGLVEIICENITEEG